MVSFCIVDGGCFLILDAHTGFLVCFPSQSSRSAYSARRAPRLCLQWRVGWCHYSLNSDFCPLFLYRQWLHPWGPVVECLFPNSWWTDPGAYQALLLPHADRLLLECHQCQVTCPPSAALWLSWSLHEWVGHPASASRPLGESWLVTWNERLIMVYH